ncbi:Lysine-specific histone demethylase 1-like 1 [Vitis vinifera]|uniref:Lysine-specific histone demethylase 1-like 1 n=1 Tax=Vitis vinifera TaxID=29760 RepID=A0A438HEG0_VITVI|nr:Lysine-specific histone demethylase 1-like 1 [Vitis vinifera]
MQGCPEVHHSLMIVWLEEPFGKPPQSNGSVALKARIITIYILSYLATRRDYPLVTTPNQLTDTAPTPPPLWNHKTSPITPPPPSPASPPPKNQSSPPETTLEVRVSDSQLDETSEPPPKKRRRRKKQFPEMISSAAAVTGLRILRPHPKSSIYSEKIMDDIIGMQINDSPALSKTHRRRRRIADLAKEVDVEALVAISVGFPVDSLTEEEIEANVVTAIGGAEQANYIVVRNHILARWRWSVSTWLTRDHAMESIRSEHRNSVNSAYSFLLEHGYINFGLAPAIREVQLKPNDSLKASVIIVGAGLAGLAAARQLIFLGFKVLILEGRSRPGGRVRTRKMKRMDGCGVIAAADLGGSVLTGINGNPLGVLARQLGFPLHKVRDICPLYLPDGRMVNSEIDSRVETSFNRLLDRVCKLRQAMMEEVKSADVSLGTALEAFRRVYKVAEDPQERMLLNWHLANLEYANASLMSDLSMAYWDQDDPYEMGGDHCFIPGGNEGVSGDMVLCTVPLGVLKKGTIDFSASTSPKKERCNSKNWVWITKQEESTMRGEFFLFYSYSSVSGGPLLVALVAGEAAINFEMMSPVEAVRRVLDILKGIFNPKGIAVPDPIQVVCTRWGKDRFTYGSYSYVAIGSSGDDYDILAESVGDGRVFFCRRGN